MGLTAVALARTVDACTDIDREGLGHDDVAIAAAALGAVIY
jgi:hypothetical protein